jgi:ribose/xylose/arabinose/galactoside ABC-type transport system permease subunit
MQTRLAAAFRPNRGAFEYAGLISLVVLFIVLSIASSAFLSKDNLLDVLQVNADIGIAACAGTLVIVAGGIDLSIGAIYALAGRKFPRRCGRATYDRYVSPFGIGLGLG